MGWCKFCQVEHSSASCYHPGNAELQGKDRRIAELEAQLENEKARGIHSCGPHCQKIECKQRREIERLRGGLKSEEPQEYVHNEVTGLHNMADLYEIERLRSALLEAPAPRTVDPETQQPQMRAEMYKNPVPKDREYANWYSGVRKAALEEVSDDQETA